MLSFALMAIFLDIVPVNMNKEVKSIDELTDEKNNWSDDEENTKVNENLASLSFDRLFGLARFSIGFFGVEALTFILLSLICLSFLSFSF